MIHKMEPLRLSFGNRFHPVNPTSAVAITPDKIYACGNFMA